MRTLPVFLWIAVLFSHLYAETFENRHAKDLRLNPPDLHFRLDTAGNRRKFQIGERIPLTLGFSSDSLDKYKLNGAIYDRSGRLPTEEFVLEQAGVTDPYEDYFGTGVIGGLAGGLRGYPILDAKPRKIELDLNEWFRFDRAGSYRLYLKSHRLTRERAPGEAGGKTVDFAVVSNIVEIEILVENQKWQAAKLAAIRTVLDQPEPEQPKVGGPPVPYNPLQEEIAVARRELRFLETPAAVQLAFEDARRKGSGPDQLLLVGARDRQAMLSAFDDYLADPDVGFRPGEIRLRALFSYVAKDSPRPLPIFAWQWPDGKADWESNRTAADIRQARFEEVLKEEALRLIPAASAKNPAARKSSAEAIGAIIPAAARAARLVLPDDYGLSRKELIQQFLEFPREQQSELLNKKWDLVRGPEIVPALLAVIAKAKGAPPPEYFPRGVWGSDDGIEEAALRRLAGLSLDDARDILQADIASGKPHFAGFAVREFPGKEIPGIDNPLRGLLKTNLGTALALAARFATVRLAGDMRELYAARPWPCEEEAAFISFFLRVAPEENGEGHRMLKRAMANREQRGCYGFLLSRVASVVWNSALQSQAILGLDDSQPEVGTMAAQVLAEHGAPEVEVFLWKRLEQWSEQWRGRAAEVAGHPITGAGPSDQTRLGESLIGAIASAESWWLDAARRKRLAGLCVEQSCKERWGTELPPGPETIDVSNGGKNYPPAFRVNGYTSGTIEGLKRKLAHAPEETHFRWCPQAENSFDAFTPGQRDEMFQDLTAFLAKQSMPLEPYQKEKCGG